MHTLFKKKTILPPNAYLPHSVVDLVYVDGRAACGEAQPDEIPYVPGIGSAAVDLELAANGSSSTIGDDGYVYGTPDGEPLDESNDVRYVL